jgi:hypothetical protein
VVELREWAALSAGQRGVLFPARLGVSAQIAGRFPGRPLLVDGSTVYIGLRGTILRTGDGGRSWVCDCTLAPELKRGVFGRSRLLTRLLRLEIMAFRLLGDGARVAIARDGIYRAEPGGTRMRRTFRFEAGRPLNLGVDGNGRIIFGEYHSNAERRPIRMYASEDGGRTFEVRHVFDAGEIRHVHSVIWDQQLGQCLVLTGDYGEECGIAVLRSDLMGIDWIVRGGQRFRAASVLVDERYITYGTDSHVEHNEILRVEKATGRIESLCTVEGSSLYAARFGPVRAISTAVEPSAVNLSREVSLYLSADGQHWSRAVVARKDRWHAVLFQFGTLVLPYCEGNTAWGAFGGQAVDGVDGQTVLISLEDDFVSNLAARSTG